jgi:hypothetical protein
MRQVFQRQGRERLAELMGVSVHTAREWWDRNLSERRAREIAAELLREMNRQDRKERALTRAMLEWAAYGDQPGETSSATKWTAQDSRDCVSGAMASRRLGDACALGF